MCRHLAYLGPATRFAAGGPVPDGHMVVLSGDRGPSVVGA
jgi:hypothetical protein